MTLTLTPLTQAGIKSEAYPKKYLSPSPKPRVHFASPLFIEGPCSYRSIMGRAGGAELKVPETQISASPEGSTRGASLCGMLHRWNFGLREETGPTRVDESGFVTAARGAEEAPHKLQSRCFVSAPLPPHRMRRTTSNKPRVEEQPRE
jgi:hypothetical protein